MGRTPHGRAWMLALLAVAAAYLAGADARADWKAGPDESTELLNLSGDDGGWPSVDQVIQARVKRHSVTWVISGLALILVPLFGFRFSSALIVIASVWAADIVFNPHPLVLVTVPLGLMSYFIVSNEFGGR